MRADFCYLCSVHIQQCLIQIKGSVYHSNAVSRGVMVMRHSCYAKRFRFESHLGDFIFFVYFFYFQAYVLPLRVSVSLALG